MKNARRVERCEDLTPLERKVLEESARGSTNKEIAQLLNLREAKVNHMLANEDSSRSIYVKIGVRNKAEASAWYQKNCSGFNPKPEQVSWWHRSHSHVYFSFCLIVTWICVVWFVFVPVWFRQTGLFNPWTSVYGVIPAVASAFGVARLYMFRLDGSKYRRPLAFFSAALAAWALGQLIWLYYNLNAKIDVPYPSKADIGYFIYEVLWVVGVGFLSRYILLDKSKRVALILVLLVMLLLVSISLIMISRNGSVHLPKDPLKLFFDIGYPFCGALAISILIVATVGENYWQIDRQMKFALAVILAGSIFMFIADTSFGISTSLSPENPLAYYNGSWSDALFSIAMCTMSVGIVQLPLSKLN